MIARKRLRLTNKGWFRPMSYLIEWLDGNEFYSIPRKRIEHVVHGPFATAREAYNFRTPND
jgi:hypothetical protein